LVRKKIIVEEDVDNSITEVGELKEGERNGPCAVHGGLEMYTKL
jgi:hypothetical protein